MSFAHHMHIWTKPLVLNKITHNAMQASVALGLEFF